jgi:transmembrane sensor
VNLCMSGLKYTTQIFRMSNNNIYQVISRHFVNTQSKKDEADLKVWINESNENKSLYEKIENHWHSPVQKKITIFKHEEVKSDIWNRLNYKQKKLNNRKKPRRANLFLKYAAVIALLICSALVIYVQLNQEASEQTNLLLVTKSNTVGRKSEIHLKDGTVVNLNSESELSYHEVFSDTARIVWLDGEAFFDVVKDPTRPFYVISQNVVVKALGTSFNVSGYSDSDQLRISLATGKVLVSDNKGKLSSEIILLPGQEVFYQKDNQTFSPVVNFESNEVEGWKDGLLFFEKADLEEIIVTLERWYGVEIQVISHPNIKMNYTGQFKSQNLKNVLMSMGFVNNFEFEINNKNVLLNFKNETYE